MRQWNMSVVESARLFSPIGVRLIDDLTGKEPLGRMQVFLDLQEPGGAWRLQERQATRSLSGVVSYPGLAWHADASGQPPQRQYRVRVKAEFYIALYQRIEDGVAFAVAPYDDNHSPQVNPLPTDVILTPAPNYPFQGHIPVLKGAVKDAANKPVPNALVTQGAKERVLTDWRGTFSLPLRWAKPNVQIPVDAVNERNGQMGTENITPPGDLDKVLVIKIQ
jgi:hypothetical protein